MYQYSIIIPHKNSPALLQRCLDSIPERDDVQIIIVDDNSNPTIVNFEQIPGKDRNNTDFFFIKDSNGAGHARNVGLQHASGKWVMFADADDFYSDGFLDVLDQYSQNEVTDIVYFGYNRVDSETLKPIRDGFAYTRELEKYSRTNNPNFFRYSFNPPWNKMVRRDLIEKHQVLFEEIPQGNDTMYSLQVGYYAQKIDVVSSPLYYYTWYEASITQRKWDNGTYILCIENLKKKNRFLEEIGMSMYKDSQVLLLLHFLRIKGFLVFLKVIYLVIRNRKNYKMVENKYVKLVLG